MSDKIKKILKESGYDFNYQIEESHVYSLMQQAYNLDRPTPVETKTAEEILAQFNEGGQNRYWKGTVLEAMEAYHAQFTPSDKGVEVEEADVKAYELFEIENPYFSPITVDKYGEINSVDIKGIFQFGFKYGSNWQQQKQADTISRLEEENERLRDEGIRLLNGIRRISEIIDDELAESICRELLRP